MSQQLKNDSLLKLLQGTNIEQPFLVINLIVQPFQHGLPTEATTFPL